MFLGNPQLISTMNEELVWLYMQMVNRRARTELLEGMNNEQEEQPKVEHESPFTKVERLLDEGLSPRQIAKITGVPRKVIKELHRE